MRILDRYIREGAPASIPLSSSCREEMLTSKASSAFIFETARQEVMALMGGGGLTYRVSRPTYNRFLVFFGFSTSEKLDVVDCVA